MQAVNTVRTANPYAPPVTPRAWQFLHRLHPLSKFAAVLPAMVMLAFVRSLHVPLVFIMVGVGFLLLGARLTRRTAAGLLLGLPVVAAVMSFSFALWTAPSAVGHDVTLFRVGTYHLYLDALLQGAATSLRLAALVVLSLICGLTTTGPDLARSLTQQLKVPYRISYTALAAFRFVPRLSGDLQMIKAAHRARGFDGGRGPLAAIRRWLGWVVPLLASGIRHAERVALAMDARAFGAHRTRTERHLVPHRLRDVLFVAAWWAGSLAIVFAT